MVGPTDDIIKFVYGIPIGFVIQKPQREWQIFNRMANVVSSPLLADTDGLIIEVADCATDY